MTRAVLIVLATLSVAACGGGDDGAELQALQNDPLARFTPPGGQLVNDEARGARGGGLFGGKATPAVVRRTFTVGDPAAAVDAALAAARDAGWTVEPPVGDLGSSGRKDLPSGGATMSVSRSGDRVTIALEHLQG